MEPGLEVLCFRFFLLQGSVNQTKRQTNQTNPVKYTRLYKDNEYIEIIEYNGKW